MQLWQKVTSDAKLNKKRKVCIFNDPRGDEDLMPLKFMDLITDDGTLKHEAWGRSVKLHTWIRNAFQQIFIEKEEFFAVFDTNQLREVLIEYQLAMALDKFG